MSAPLDSRVIRIVRWLMSQDRPRSTLDLASDLGLSERVVRYRLSAVQNYFRTHGVELVRQRGSGLSVIADDTQRAAIDLDLDDRTQAPRVYAPDEREHLLLDALLWAHPSTISLDRLNEDLEVSKTSARRDLRRCEPWLERMGIPVLRKPGKGIALVASEQRIRRAIVQLLLEAVPPDVIAELANTDFSDAHLVHVRVPAGLRDRFERLPFRSASTALAESGLHERLAAGNGELVYALYVAITQARIEQGCRIELEPGQFLSSIDHPASEVVRTVIEPLSTNDPGLWSDEEVAGLTEYFLGFEALSSITPGSQEIDVLVSHVLDLATERLHASLADDDELRRSLTLHLNRLSVRLRYGLPVHNPLRAEVAERYPDVQVVADEAAALLSEHFGSVVHDDEVGFITMYLSGAMERAHLRPRKRALVVCPSGMATAWVLVSRLQAEFPELSLVEVLSESVYERRTSSEFDVVISTVPLTEFGAPVFVVSPLLSAQDVRNLNEIL